MRWALVGLLLPALAVAAAAVLIWALRLRRGLERETEENQRLRQVLLLGAHSGQEELQALRQLRHDLRHYLLTTGASAAPDEASQTLSRSLERPLPGAAGGQSWALTALERHYRGQGERLGFHTDIQLNLALAQEMLLPDLCLVVSNLLENAVEALQREGGGWLRARAISAPGYVSLVVGNSCSRMPKVHNGRYLSSKEKGRVGVGLATVQEVARRCGGSWEFTADGTQFRAFVFLPCPMAQRTRAGNGGTGERAAEWDPRTEERQT